MANIESIIQQLRNERDRLDAAIAALKSMGNTAGTAPKSGRRTMSPTARKRIAAARRARWQKVKAAKQKSVPASKPGRQRRTISAEGLARIRAAQRKRWAKVRAGKKK
jgi:hypothetical protein